MESIYLKLAENRVVETKRLLLRPVTLDDAEDMFEYSSDEENTRYTFYLIKIWKKLKILLLVYLLVDRSEIGELS